MIEIPEAIVLSRQLASAVVGQRIHRVIAAQTPRQWAWFSGHPDSYPSRLEGKAVEGTCAWGGFVCLQLSGNARQCFGEGVQLRWFGPGAPRPLRHQLLLEFESGGALVATVQMYGSLHLEDGEDDGNPYIQAAEKTSSPLSPSFSLDTLAELSARLKGTPASLKALLATEQRIPGLGNGVLQDILYEAKLHPRTRVVDLTAEQTKTLHRSIQETLRAMAEKGGRDTETLLFGKPGSYATKASRLTLGRPCCRCGDPITKESYMGGTVYTCPTCQPQP